MGKMDNWLSRQLMITSTTGSPGEDEGQEEEPEEAEDPNPLGFHSRHRSMTATPLSVWTKDPQKRTEMEAPALP